MVTNPLITTNEIRCSFVKTNDRKCAELVVSLELSHRDLKYDDFEKKNIVPVFQT
jgi:hypothetical protein